MQPDRCLSGHPPFIYNQGNKMWPEQQLNNQKSEEELRLEHAMNNATVHDKAKWTLLEWYSAHRTKEGYLHSDIKTQHNIIISETDPKESIDYQIELKTEKILKEIAKIMQRFNDDTIHITSRTQKTEYEENSRGPKKYIISITYYLLSDRHYKS